MGTRRSKHNKGRKPAYKEHRRGGVSNDVLNERYGIALPVERPTPPTSVPEVIAKPNINAFSGRHVRAYTRPATGNVLNAGFNYLSELIVRPGIEKRLWPVLLYRGGLRPGQAHRLWNFSLLMMASEAETLSDGLKLHSNPAFSQLCGPIRVPQKQTLNSFFGRLWDNPDTTDLIPGFTEYVKSLELGASNLLTVELESYRRKCAPWRVSLHPEGRLRPEEWIKERGTPQLFYPYAVHDTARPDDGRDLVKLVNDAVPRELPEQWRADVCQELIVSVLAGEIAKGEVHAYVQKFISKAFSAAPTKFAGDFFPGGGLKLSLDAPIAAGGDDRRSLHDVMHSGDYDHWSDTMSADESSDDETWERADISLAAKDYHYEQMQERHRHFNWMRSHGHASQIDDLFQKQVCEKQIELQEQGLTLHHHEVIELLENDEL
jgi:hypothetical protein